MALYADEKRQHDTFSSMIPQLTTRRRKGLLAALGILALYFVWNGVSTFQKPTHKRPSYLISQDYRDNASHAIPHIAFPPAELVDYRTPDSLDAFSGYKYRNTCNISSLDLHLPFSPLCQTRQEMLTAMSGGGRIGHDAPYMPRGCDMRWFTTEEICEIMSRFHKVIIVGDSMMRHIIGSLNVFMRKDLGYGAVTDWNFSPEERRDCFCNYQFNVKACSIQGIFKTEDVISHDPESFMCDAAKVNVDIEVIVRFPIPEEEITRFKSILGEGKPSRPIAFIYGHGLWNDLDLQAHLNWIDEILEATTVQLPYLAEPGALWPRLVVTPNAAGIKKPDEWLISQGNKALSMYEHSVRIEDGRRGIEHLGTYNMSVQANMYDGGHCDLRGNLIKAMMVMNWLNMIEVEKH